MTEVCDFITDIIGRHNEAASGEAPTDDWRTAVSGILAEGLVYIATELPGDEWIRDELFHSPEAIAGALRGVQQQRAEAEGQNG